MNTQTATTPSTQHEAERSLPVARHGPPFALPPGGTAQHPPRKTAPAASKLSCGPRRATVRPQTQTPTNTGHPHQSKAVDQVSKPTTPPSNPPRAASWRSGRRRPGAPQERHYIRNTPTAAGRGQPRRSHCRREAPLRPIPAHRHRPPASSLAGPPTPRLPTRSRFGGRGPPEHQNRRHPTPTREARPVANWSPPPKDNALAAETISATATPKSKTNRTKSPPPITRFSNRVPPRSPLFLKRFIDLPLSLRKTV